MKQSRHKIMIKSAIEIEPPSRYNHRIPTHQRPGTILDLNSNFFEVRPFSPYGEYGNFDTKEGNMRKGRYPNFERSLNEYLNDPRNSRIKSYMSTEGLIDSFLKTLGIVIPRQERKDRAKVDKYFARAETILSQKTLFS